MGQEIQGLSTQIKTKVNICPFSLNKSFVTHRQQMWMQVIITERHVCMIMCRQYKSKTCGTIQLKKQLVGDMSFPGEKRISNQIRVKPSGRVRKTNVSFLSGQPKR